MDKFGGKRKLQEELDEEEPSEGFKDIELEDHSSPKKQIEDTVEEEEEENVVSVDDAMELCGGFGRYQVLHCFAMILSMGSLSFWFFGLQFFELMPKYLCDFKGDGEYHACETTDFCFKPEVKWKYDWEDPETLDNLIDQYSLQCSTKWEMGLFGTLMLTGMVVGSISITRFADIYGRKWIYLAGAILIQINLFIFMIGKTKLVAFCVVFILGLLTSTKQFVGYTYLLEIVPQDYQVFVGSLQLFVESIMGICTTLFFAFVSKIWYQILIPGFILVVPCIIFISTQDESPKFLVSTFQYDRARIALRKIAQRNGTTNQYDQAQIVFEIEHKEKLARQTDNQLTQASIITSNKERSHQSSIKTLCKDKLLRRNLVFMSIVWAANILTFYIMVFYLRYFTGSIYGNTIALSLSDCVSYIISGLILKRIGLRNSLLMGQTISCVGGILYLCLNSHEQLVPILISLCRIGNVITYNNIYMANTRLYPTQFQTTTFGFQNFVAHILGVVAPMIDEIGEPYPFFIFIICMVIAIFASVFVKEIQSEAEEEFEVKIE